MSIPPSASGATDSTPFEQVRGAARAWILNETYTGRTARPGDFESHETYVNAPTRVRADDCTPLPLPSLLDPTPTTPSPSRGRGRTTLGIGATLGAAVVVAVAAGPVADLVALAAGALGAAVAARGSRPDADERLAMRAWEVVPEVAFVYRLLKAAPARLLALHADPEAVAVAERAWETVLREVPRLPVEAWDYRRTGSRHRWVNAQSGTTPYERIMDSGAEVLVMLRAAEEREYALAPHATRTGPWSQLTAEPVVVEMLAQARLAQDLQPRLR